jgi:signal transduction histidine kinase
LRTPLNAILGLSESLAEGVYGDMNTKQVKSINTIAESGHHLLSLINDLLDIAKIGAGKMELELSKVNVEEVCQASLRFVM